ncbi:TIGR00725 family protein [Haladaptatus sp. GCM10025707]|uniref:TIGR00725 family protein n=1 Tax=unclassified Haladaptatus TaxID=2622732 RepID=UPI0023E7908C|nr:TIGR00725 family protein [Haladaptatus sp. QDMS2]
MRVSVIGGSTVDDETYDLAVAVGNELASRGHAVVCGGRGGVMEAACRGAREEDGETIGILPGTDPAQANAFVTTPIATGIGNARNVLVVLNGAAVIAIDGHYGTLSELGHALDFGKPVAGLHTHEIDGVKSVKSPLAAISHVESAVR